MRSIFILLLTSIALFSYAQTATIVANKSGDWHSSSTWDINRPPKDGDIVDIPYGITVKVVNTPYDESLAIRPQLRINIYGTLDFTDPGNDKLYLDNGSVIQIFNSGTITTNKNNEEIIAIFNGTSDNIVWDGNPQSLSGPNYASASTIGFDLGILPIKLEFFTAQVQSSRIVLKWSTAEESNNSHFEVEKSTNARQWTFVQRIAAEGQPADYTYSDAAPAGGDVYYRLKSVDLDGKSEFSHVVKVARSRSLTAYINPNPAREQVTVSLSTASAAPLQVQLVASNGQVAQEGFFAKGSSLIRLNLRGTKAGIYTLVLREGSSVIEASQLLIQ